MGLWVVRSAELWTKTTFVRAVALPSGSRCLIVHHQVGLDAMNVQLPLSMLPPDVAVRIEWVHANVYGILLALVDGFDIPAQFDAEIAVPR